MADETPIDAPVPDDEPGTPEALASEPTVAPDETPAASEPEAAGPEAVVSEPEAAEPDAAEPEAAVIEPDAAEPEAAEPEAAASEPDADDEPEAPTPTASETPETPATPKPEPVPARAQKPAAAKPKPKPAAKPARPGLRDRVKRRGKPAVTDRELPVVRAQAKYVRTSARKARLVCDHIRGKSVAEAEAILAFAPRAVAADWAKLLKSAVANAENNHELLGENLRVKEAFADEGPTLKRFRPRAMGRATPIRKRTSHLTITLTPKE
jgi:ribosomal protein L22